MGVVHRKILLAGSVRLICLRAKYPRLYLLYTPAYVFIYIFDHALQQSPLVSASSHTLVTLCLSVPFSCMHAPARTLGNVVNKGANGQYEFSGTSKTANRVCKTCSTCPPGQGKAGGCQYNSNTDTTCRGCISGTTYSENHDLQACLSCDNPSCGPHGKRRTGSCTPSDNG